MEIVVTNVFKFGTDIDTYLILKIARLYLD